MPEIEAATENRAEPSGYREEKPRFRDAHTQDHNIQRSGFVTLPVSKSEPRREVPAHNLSHIPPHRYSNSDGCES